MLRHQLISAFRHLKKNPSYTLLNVTVLGVGFLAGLLMMVYGIFIMNYDGFHPAPDATYSLEVRSKSAFGMGTISLPPYSMLYAEVEKYPTIKGATRLYESEVPQVQIPGSQLTVRGGMMYRVDEGFPNLFHFPLVQGDWQAMFKGSNGVIISEQLADRLPYTNAVGETINLSSDGPEYTILGIMAEHPANSSLEFDLVSATTARDSISWTATNNPMLFAKVEQPEEIEAVITGLNSVLKERFGSATRLEGVALKDLYFNSTLVEVNGDRQSAWTMIGLAALIVLISVLNYISSYTSILTKRTKEFGVRMILGSHRSQLIGQSLSDAFVLFLITLILAQVVIYTLGLQLFGLLGLEVQSVSQIISPGTLSLCVLALLMVALLMMSVYPIVLVRNFNPANMLRADQGNLGFAGRFRLLLVGLQMIVAVTLINYTAILGHQMEYLQGLPLGFDLEDKVYIDLQAIDMPEEEMEVAVNRFRNSLTGNASVAGVSVNPILAMYDMLQMEIHTGERVSFFLYKADPEFAEVMGLSIVDGENLTDANRANSILVNERAAQLLYPDDVALGKGIPGMGNKRIVGITADLYHRGFMGGSGPMVVTADEFNPTNLFIKTDNIQEARKAIEEAWEVAFPGKTLDYESLSSRYNQQYLSAQVKETNLVLSAALIAVILSSLGVIGIAAYNLNTKAKELSVRIILGARWNQILLLQVKYFLIALGISALIGVPSAYFLGQRFLENYTARPIFPFWLLIAGVVLVLAMVVLAVLSQFMGFRRQNPINNLRS
ncbi:MAG: ABC transporter permease [Bacteroidota bacterium]